MLNKKYLAAVILLAACGSDDDKGGSAVDGSKKGSSLTAEEANMLCESVTAKGPSPEAFCTAYAALLSADKATCGEAAKGCIDEVDSEDPCDDAMSDLAGCDLTVKEIETCLNAQGKLLSDAVDGVTCDDAGSDDLPDLEKIVEEVPSECKNVVSMCPKLVE